jgi:hypothetical protein
MNNGTREVVLVEAAMFGVVAFACVVVMGLLTRLIIVGAPLLASAFRQSWIGPTF